MLAGKLPFEADSAVSVALMQLQKEPQRLTDINPDIPLGLEQICIHAMQKNPEDRYQTATEMLLDLEEVIRNPKATFDYTYFVDKEPTKYVFREETGVADDSDEENDYFEEEEYIDPNHKKKVITAVIVGVALLVGAIIGLVMWITQGVNTDTETLENFAGQSYDQLISSDAYNYEFVAEYQETDDYPSGTVISQVPEAGERVIAGSKVTLIVAKSADDIPVPNCYGLTLEKAERMLSNSKLNVYKTAEISSETVEEGSVVYTDPKAGSVVSADREIVIYVSTGPSTTVINSYIIPDVSGLSQNDAKNFLKKSGFTNVNIETSDNPLPKGIVISQSPSAGKSVKENDAIKLIVSTGITTTAPPETSEQYTISIRVNLPNCKDTDGKFPTDSLIVYVDGSQEFSKTVTLNGTGTDIAIPADSGSEVSITVSLSNLGASQNFKMTMNQDKNKTVDFTEYSDNKEE